MDGGTSACAQVDLLYVVWRVECEWEEWDSVPVSSLGLTPVLSKSFVATCTRAGFHRSERAERQRDGYHTARPNSIWLRVYTVLPVADQPLPRQRLATRSTRESNRLPCHWRHRRLPNQDKKL
jgi:hypothetical protein